jgi:hypothetical protein
MTTAPALPIEIDYGALVDGFADAFKGGGGFTRVMYPGNGDTIVEFFRDSRFESTDTANFAGMFAPAEDIYRTGDVQKKFLFLALVHAYPGNTDKLNAGWNGDFSKDEAIKAKAEAAGANVALVPFLLPKTAAVAVLSLIKDGVTLGEFDAETGEITSHASNVIRINKSKTGDKTSYTVSPIQKPSGAIKASIERATVALVPEMTLTEAAQDYTRFQKERASKNEAPNGASGPSKPDTGSDDFM